MSKPELKPVPQIQKIIAVLWPSFIIAGMATIGFFTFFDPVQLLHLEVSNEAAYSTGFFIFWLLTLSSSLLTLYFQLPTHYISPPPIIDKSPDNL